MRSAWSAAVLLAAAALLASEGSAESAETAVAAGEGREADQEDDSDTAPFMIVVEHEGGRRCSGSLVSLRTVLTSAACAGAGAELWAVAPGAGAARRVARVALAAGAGAAGLPWAGAAVDLAVLELESPFGGGARSRPILMATQAAECAAGATCHVVRALGGGRAPRLRIVDAALSPGERCAARAPGWPGLRDTALCLVGPTLCESDWGAGVVCEGKLCGVLSRSAREAGAEGAGGAEGADDSCGDVHVAQSIPRWRKFLHCAHTLRACGSGGECGQLCSERRLLGADGDGSTPQSAAPASEQRTDSASSDAAEPGDSSARTEAAPELTTAVSHTLPTTHAQSAPRPLRLQSAAPPTRSAPPAAPAPGSTRGAFEFEPNRPDFKAGEYGDNAADYGGEDAPPTSSARPPPPPSSTAPPADADAATASLAATPLAAPSTWRETELEARVRARPLRAAAPPRASSACLLYVLVAITNLAN